MVKHKWLSELIIALILTVVGIVFRQINEKEIIGFIIWIGPALLLLIIILYISDIEEVVNKQKGIIKKLNEKLEIYKKLENHELRIKGVEKRIK